MRSARIVQMQGLIDSPAGLRHRPELVIQKVFLLEDPIHTLRHSILSAMVFFGHTDRQARLLQPIHDPQSRNHPFKSDRHFRRQFHDSLPLIRGRTSSGSEATNSSLGSCPGQTLNMGGV